MRLIPLYLIFISTIWAQSSVLKGSLEETGYFFKKLTFDWQPTDPRNSPSYSARINNFSISFKDISILEEVSKDQSFTEINYDGPEINLDKLHLQKRAFEPDWIARQYLHRIEKRHQRPKEGIQLISNGLNLYVTDHQAFPTSINELDVKGYINLSDYPFDSRYWHYMLKLPNTIVAVPTKEHPIKTVNSVQFDLNYQEFVLDRITDSLKTSPMTFWDYSFDLFQISQTLSHQLKLKEWDDRVQNDYYLDKGSLSIGRAVFNASPENTINNRFTVKLPKFELGFDDIWVSQVQESIPMVESGKIILSINNFEINIPEGLRHEPEIKNLLSSLGIWNNTLKLRQVDISITILNRYTGELNVKIIAPFFTIDLTGDFQLHQEGYFPEISFHDTLLEINPIAIGVRNWINKWENKNDVVLPRKGSKVIIEIDGTLLNPIFHGIR